MPETKEAEADSCDIDNALTLRFALPLTTVRLAHASLSGELRVLLAITKAEGWVNLKNLLDAWASRY